MNIEYISVWVVEIELISVWVVEIDLVFVRVDEKDLVFVSGHRDWLDIRVGIDINLIWVLAELDFFCVGDRKKIEFLGDCSSWLRFRARARNDLALRGYRN